MKVDVVVRTHNRPVLLRRALDSVARQTHRGVAIVVVNDAGEPGPVHALVDGLPEPFRSHVRIIDNETSAGREAAMNVGLAAGEGPLFAIHDDDDTWEPEFLAKCVAHLEHTDDVAVAVRTDIVHEALEGDTVIELRRETLSADSQQVTLVDTLVRNYAPPISMVYRRELLDAVGWIDGSLPVLADWEFNLRVLAHGTVGFLDGVTLAHWHHRADTIGDAGNSVVAAADDHRIFNVLVRDRYLRRMADHSGSLAIPLLVAEYHDRLQRSLDHGFHSVQESISLTHAATIAELLRQNDRYEAANDRYEAANDRCEAAIDRCEAAIDAQARRIGELEGVLRALANSPLRRLGRRARALLRVPPQP